MREVQENQNVTFEKEEGGAWFAEEGGRDTGFRITQWQNHRHLMKEKKGSSNSRTASQGEEHW